MNLFKHQKDGIDFSLYRNSVALFWDMGLGKTRTCLEIFKRKMPCKLFVICPLSLVHEVWEREANFYGLTFCEFKKSQAADVIAINYESFISKKYFPAISEFVKSTPCMCVLDESSRLKNYKSITTKLLLSLSKYFPYKIVASGTPMPNSELELWGQLKFLDDNLFPSFFAFRNQFFQLTRNGKIQNGNFYSRAAMMELMRTGWRYTISDAKRRELMVKIAPLCHWVKKEDALDLPDKIFERREVFLSPPELKTYKEMKQQLITELDDISITAQAALTKIIKLRQVTSGFLYDAEGVAHDVCRPSKLAELESLLEELGSQQVIIWIQFRHEVEYISKVLFDKCVTLYAETKDKEDSITRFKNGAAQYLIAHPRSAAHGLTLTNCSTEIFYSLDYSYEAHSQAQDRIHRISQTKNCLYIYLLASKTIDYDILDVLDRKKSLEDIVHGFRNKL